MPFTSGLASAPAPTVYDVVVYGATPGGITAAYEAKRQGRSVIIVGGWRESQVGGMPAGGLGASDFVQKNACRGLSRAFFKAVNDLKGTADDGTQTNFNSLFEGRFAKAAYQNWLTALSIPVVLNTGGVSSVDLAGTAGVDKRITKIHTTDGHEYSGLRFIDASYEVDLAAMAGVPYTIGREASNASNTANGWRSYGSAGQFQTNTNVLVTVDPWNTPGNTSSGLLPGVVADPSLTAGTADSRVQAYNFRLMMNNTSNGGRRVTMFPSGIAPANYNSARYELLFRWMAAVTAAGGALGLGDIISAGGVGNFIWDINNSFLGGQSTDNVGANYNYPDGSYATRQAIWQDHIDYINGFWYALQYQSDARMIAAIRTSALNYGYDTLHPDPFVQLYVREGRRIVANQVFTGADVASADGTTPISTKTIASGNYFPDSHQCTLIARNDAGVWKAWYEGGMSGAAGGADGIFPIPYDITLPATNSIENLAVTFGVSATHHAFSACRVEDTHMQIGQALGMAAAVSIETGQWMRNVNYATLRSRLLAVPDAVPPNLPQLN